MPDRAASEMVERVAQRLFDQEEDRDPMWCKPWGQIPDTGKTRFRADARAAIEVMRQATVEMSHQGQRVIDAGDAAFPSDACWNAMIDSALSEEPGT